MNKFFISKYRTYLIEKLKAIKFKKKKFFAIYLFKFNLLILNL